MKRLDRTKPPPGWEYLEENHRVFTTRPAGKSIWCEALIRDPACDLVADIGRERARAMVFQMSWDTYDKETAPAIEDALAQVVEWLRAYAKEQHDIIDSDTSLVAAEAYLDAAATIESGEWRTTT